MGKPKPVQSFFPVSSLSLKCQMDTCHFEIIIELVRFPSQHYEIVQTTEQIYEKVSKSITNRLPVC